MHAYGKDLSDLKQLKERMELALQGSKTSILDWDFITQNIYISPSWKAMLGYTDEELGNSTWTWKRRVHRDDFIKTIRLLAKHEKRKSTYFESTHRLKHRNGHWIWVLGRAKIIYNEHGHKVRMVGTHTDITEEKELQLTYFYQSQMIEQIHDSVMTTDLKGNILSWNHGSQKTFGYSADEAIGQSVAVLYQEKDRIFLPQHVEALLTTGIYNADYDLQTKSGELIPISFSLSLLRDAQGNPMGIVGINKDNTRRKKAEDALLEQKEILHYQAHHDALTGLPNRTYFMQSLQGCIERSTQEGLGFALFFIDLDKFKDINDSLGHEVGDIVLKIIAQRLQEIVQGKDILARLSGDEFTVIMANIQHDNDAEILAKDILSLLKQPVEINGEQLYVSGSIGITRYPDHASNAEFLLKYADTAMYNAKKEGRDTYNFYNTEMTEQAHEHMAMKTGLRQAIDNEEFVVHYQAQIDTANHTLIGLEALVRWNHPTKGLLSPCSFIPLAEETGMVIEIDSWMMQTAMKQVSLWYKEGLNPGVLALNLSIKQLERKPFLQELQDAMSVHNFKAEWLELEITERQMIKKTEDAIKKLEEINTLGIAISIDDFGTGYSSLSLLKRLPINRLKIDKSFIADLPNNKDDVAIIEAIIALGKSLKLKLIAEGVETEAQKDFLVSHGCTQMQGYHFCRPVTKTEIAAKLLNHKLTTSPVCSNS